MEDFFLGGDLASQARWMYRTLLRGATVARKAESALAGTRSLKNKLQSSVKANAQYKDEVKSLQTQLADAKKQIKTSDAVVARLTKQEISLEAQLSAVQGRVKELEKEHDKALSLATAVKTEAADLKKYKETVKQGKSAILVTEEAIKAQVKLLAPDFNTSAVSVFKTIKDGKIVDIPKK